MDDDREMTAEESHAPTVTMRAQVEVAAPFVARDLAEFLRDPRARRGDDRPAHGRLPARPVSDGRRVHRRVEGRAVSDDTPSRVTSYCAQGCGAVLPLESHHPDCPAVGGKGFGSAYFDGDVRDPMPPGLPDRVIGAFLDGTMRLDALLDRPATPWPHIASAIFDGRPSPDALAAAAMSAVAFADAAEPKVWEWLNRHDSPWSPSDATVRELAYTLGTLAAPIVEPPRIPTPKLDAARKGVFDWRSMLTERTPAADIAARVSALLVAEDERMRRDVLPAAPAGYEWDSTLEPTSEPDGIIGDVRLRLVYRLRKVEP